MDEHPSPAGLLLALDYTFYYAFSDEYGRWCRGANLQEGVSSFDVAYEEFWLLVKRAETIYMGAVHGNPADLTSDVYDYADEFSIDPDQYQAALAAFQAQPGPFQWFTVWGAWDSGNGYRQNVSYYEAINAQHAEFLWRSEKPLQDAVLVSAVTPGKGDDRAGLDRTHIYCTKSGSAPGSAEEQELDRVEQLLHPQRPRHWWNRD